MPNLILAFAAGFLIAWFIQALLRKRDSRVASEAHGEMLRHYLEVSRIRMQEMEKMRERIQEATQGAARWREAFLEAHEIKQGCGLTTDGHVRLEIGRVTELTIVDHKAVEHVVGGAYLSSCQFGLTGGGSRLKLIAEFTT